MRLTATIVAICLPIMAMAQSTITTLKGEQWWALPLTEQGEVSLCREAAEQRAAAVVSSKGRYIYGQKPFRYHITDGAVEILSSEEVAVQKSGKSLRDATLLLGQKMGMNSRVGISKEPIYIAECKKETLEHFTESGLAKGAVIIRSWQRRDGSFDFDSQRLVEICQELSERGYRPLLEVSPLLGGDTPEAIEAVENGWVVEDSSGDPMVVRHKGGFSLIYDLENSQAAAHFNRAVKRALDRASAKGVYFNYGDITPLKEMDEEAIAIRYAEAIDSLEVTSAMLSNAVVTHSLPKGGSVEEVITMAIAAPFAAVREIITVGEGGSDQLVMLAHLGMPIYQVAITDNFRGELEMLKRAEAIRGELEGAIEEAIKERQKTGAPVIRDMEYEFPAKGFANCRDQYMIGSKILVAPHTSDKKRMVRLPTGKWRDSSGNLIKGPVVIAAPESVTLPYYERVKK